MHPTLPDPATHYDLPIPDIFNHHAGSAPEIADTDEDATEPATDDGPAAIRGGGMAMALRMDFTNADDLWSNNTPTIATYPIEPCTHKHTWIKDSFHVA